MLRISVKRTSLLNSYEVIICHLTYTHTQINKTELHTYIHLHDTSTRIGTNLSFRLRTIIRLK